ncbi:hypothetical protein C0584_02485 [Candidatus Parcubacteria bacterium]|nr:MAG: hypothetical protein C0584_02485 [Candidatus Parcubacteria bacterium]
MKAIIFDFDGVIHNTFEFHRTRVKNFTGIELNPEEYRNMHKKNMYLNIPKAFESVSWSEYSKFIHEDMANLKTRNKTKEAIRDLAKKHNLYIITSGTKKNISAYLERNKILDNFKDILGVETHKMKIEKFKYLFKKYKTKESECVFVTDTLGDICEANEVGVKTIAVDFGFHSREVLNEGNPFRIISRFEEIKNLV